MSCFLPHFCWSLLKNRCSRGANFSAAEKRCAAHTFLSLLYQRVEGGERSEKGKRNLVRLPANFSDSVNCVSQGQGKIIYIGRVDVKRSVQLCSWYWLGGPSTEQPPRVSSNGLAKVKWPHSFSRGQGCAAAPALLPLEEKLGRGQEEGAETKPVLLQTCHPFLGSLSGPSWIHGHTYQPFGCILSRSLCRAGPALRRAGVSCEWNRSWVSILAWWAKY